METTSSNPGTVPRVVFDCPVFLQAITSGGGPAFACFEALEAERFRLYLSPDIQAELRDVLSRPKLQTKFKNLTPERVDLFLDRVERLSQIVTEVPEVISFERDPKDTPYLNLALVVSARYLVTRDRDLLDLMDSSRESGRAFRGLYPDLLIVDPVTFLRRLWATAE